MGPGVEYILRARDLLSGVLKNASKAAENVSKSVDGVGRSTEKAMSQAEKSVSRASQSWKNYMDNVRQSNTETNNLASGIGRVVGTLAVLQGIKSIVQMGADLEQSKISFDVLLGSAEKARIMLAGINKFANDTPYENKGLIDNAKMMLSFGTSAEKILPNLKMLGDIAMGDANKMSSLTLAFSQMSSAGKLQGQDLLQMINAGFNPLQELQKMTGKSMGTLRAEMEKGKISASMIEGAFQHATSKGGLFFGMMDKMSQTASGKFSTLVGTLRQTGAEIGLKLLPYANDLMNHLMPMVDWIAQNSKMVLQLTGVLLGALVAFKLVSWGIQLCAIATDIWTGALVLNPVGLVVAGIAALIAILVIAWNRFDWFRGIVLGLWEVLKMFFGFLKGILQSIWTVVVIVFGALADAVVSVWNKFSWLRTMIFGVWDAFKLFVGFIKNVVVGVIVGLVDTFVGLGKIIKGIFSADWNSVKAGAIQAGKGYLSAISGGLINSGTNTASKIGETFSKGYNKGISSFAKSQTDKKSGLNASSLTGSLAGGGTGGINPDDKVKSIAGGGSKPTNINITLKDLVGQITINPKTVEEGAKNIHDIVLQELSRVLNSANKMAHE